MMSQPAAALGALLLPSYEAADRPLPLVVFDSLIEFTKSAIQVQSGR